MEPLRVLSSFAFSTFRDSPPPFVWHDAGLLGSTGSVTLSYLRIAGYYLLCVVSALMRV